MKLYDDKKEKNCRQIFSYQKSNDINFVPKSHTKLYHYFLFLVIVQFYILIQNIFLCDFKLATIMFSFFLEIYRTKLFINIIGCHF